MTQVCRPAKCIEAIRVALLDPCTLEPVCGPLNGYAMGCIIEPNWTPEIEEGEESIVKDNCGNICLRDDRCDLTKRWNIEFKIKDPDKEFLSLIEGNPLIVEDGVSIGVRHLAYGACSPFVFLELFERTDDCQPDGDPIYLRHVFPAARLKWTGNEREGIFRILQIEGKSRDVLTDSIGTGPFEDIPVGALVGASPSERIDYAWFEDDFVPTLQCGAIEVPCPEPEGPTVASAQSTGCENFSLVGSEFLTVNHIQLIGTFGNYDYYDPLGPDVGLNPITSTSVQWNTGIIEFIDTQLAGETITAVHMWATGDSPDYGIFDFPDFDIVACPEGFTIAQEGNGSQSAGGTAVDNDSQGRYLVSATVDVGGLGAAGVYRFLADGTPDTSWGTNGLVTSDTGDPSNDTAAGVAVDNSDDSVYVLAVRDRLVFNEVIVLKYTSLGVLDGTFGTGGIQLIGTGSSIPKGIFFEQSTGNAVVAWNDNTIGAGDGTGTLTRINTSGATVDSVQFSYQLRGVGEYYDDVTEGRYVAMLQDATLLDYYVATANLTTTTINEALIAGDLVATPTYYRSPGVKTDTDDLFVYIAAEEAAGVQGSIGKFDIVTLAADATFGTGGIQKVTTGAWVSAAFHEVVAITAGASGDIVVSGRADGGLGERGVTARLSLSGVLVGTYGTGGIQEYPEFSPVDNSSAIYDTLIEEFLGRTVHVGWTFDAATIKAFIARTDLTTGALDLTFG